MKTNLFRNGCVKRITVSALCLSMLFSLSGCAGKTSADAQTSEVVNDETNTSNPEILNVAYQYGLAYNPLIICQAEGLIEKAYKENTGKDVEIVWNQMSSGADINTAIAAGDIDVAFMGIGPAITGISKKLGYKIFTNLSGQEHGLMTNDENVNSLEDLINSEDQIALVNIGAIQHIILAKTLEENGYDPHCLDSRLVAMKHPDGMSAVQSGAIACHLTSSPYIFKEREDGSLHEIMEVSDFWNADRSFIVGVAAEKLHDNKPQLYDALSEAFTESKEILTNQPEKAAKITCEYNGNTEQEELQYILKGTYGTETSGIFELAQFMYDNAFITDEISDYSDLVFDNVSGD